MSDESELPPPLDDELRALLRAEARRSPPPSDVSRAVMQRLEQTLGLPPMPPPGAGSGGGPQTPPAAGAPVPSSSASSIAGSSLGGASAVGAVKGAGLALTWLSSAALIGFGIVVGAGAHATLVSPPPPVERIVEKRIEVRVPVPTTGASEVRELPDELPQLDALIVPPPASRKESQTRSAPSVQEAETRDRTLQRENALLSRAQSAMARREATLALAALEQHASEFPRGQFAEEREALWVQALALSGDLEAARARATRFQKRFPDSMLLPVVETAIGGAR